LIKNVTYRKLVGKSLRGRYHSYSHNALEKGFTEKSFSKILEIGAGEGEHVKHVKVNFEEYILTDIIDMPDDVQIVIRNVYFKKANAEKLEFNELEFDRVIVTCVLHHLEKPLEALREIRRVTKLGGKISILLPSDPGFLFRSIRKITADRFLKKQGVANVKLLRALEHRNHIESLDQMIREIFRNDKVEKRVYPFPAVSWNGSLFSVYQVTISQQSQI
jgi:phosphatidylethanolamine/phosphatidyl-N-methylethanolamine N-methyltransferase